MCGMGRLAAAIVFAALLVSSARAGCGFRFDPASLPHYYRAEGWQLPGTTDFKTSAMPHISGVPLPRRPIPGVVFQLLPHDDPFVIRFGEQVFDLNGAHYRMRSLIAKATVIRVMIDGKVVAYSYGLAPVSAERKNGKWMVHSEGGCEFEATFIDDKGDGVFRLLVPGAFTQDLIPAWAKPPTT